MGSHCRINPSISGRVDDKRRLVNLSGGFMSVSVHGFFQYIKPPHKREEGRHVKPKMEP
jgi:hypothetical protein